MAFGNGSWEGYVCFVEDVGGLAGVPWGHGGQILQEYSAFWGLLVVAWTDLG